ncbi:MAG: hypothetical protein RSP_05070 [Rhodanobacter sp.]
MTNRISLYASTLAVLVFAGAGIPADAQSLLSRLGQAVSNAVANKVAPQSSQAYAPPSTGDGLHSKIGHLDWHYPKWTPDTIDGAMHLRLGTASLNQFNSPVGGYPTCDDRYLGYAILHRTELTPQDATYCLSREQQNDPSATMETVRHRMAQIAQQVAGSGKFYTRGTVQKIWLDWDPFNHPLPSGKGVLQFGEGGGLPISSPSDTDFRIVGPNWFNPGSASPGWVGHGFYMLFNADPALKMQWEQLSQASEVFYHVESPRNPRKSTWQMHHTMYDVTVIVDKIVLENDATRLVLTPPITPNPIGR